MTARKPAPTHEPWQQHETDSDQSIWLKPALIATVVFSAGFVWFVAHSVSSHSGFGRTIAFLLNSFAIVLLLGAMAGVVLAVVAGARRTARVVPKTDGRFPMRYSHLDSAEAAATVVGGLVRSRYAEASRALPPGVQSVSQSQSTSTFDVGDESQEPIALTPDALVTWSDLDQAGEIRSDGAIVIGWDMIEETLVRLDFKRDLGTIFFLGMSGAGKSTAAAAVAAQIAKRGGKLIICDPHGGEDSDGQREDESLAAFLEGLTPAFLIPPSSTDREITSALTQAMSILQARIDGDKDRSPVLVFVDEWTRLVLKDDGTMQDALTLIGVEGRKYEVNACLFAQLGTKQECGPVRDVATSTFTFRTRADHARYAIGRGTNVDIRNYGDGQCYVQARRETFERVQMPLVTAQDLVAVGQTLGATDLPKLTRPPLHLVAEIGPDGERWGMSLDDDDQFDSQEELQVVQLYKLGKSTQQIVQTMRGVPPGGTRRYRKLRDAVEAIIRVRLRDAEGGEQ